VLLTDADRDAFVAWLQGDDCLFFTESSEPLAVQLEEIDTLLRTGGGLQSSLTTLGGMSRRGLKFTSFAELLPALKAELQQQPVVGTSVVPATSQSESSAWRLSDAERDQVVQVLSDSALFSETSEPLEVDPSDLDILCADALGAEALLATLRVFDSRGTKAKNFRELFVMLREHFAQAAHMRAQSASVGAAAADDGLASSDPNAKHAPLSAEDSNTLVAYISSEQCLLFSTSSEDLVVEPSALDALFAAGGSEIGALIPTLHKLDACFRRFTRFDDLIPAVSSARASGSHIGDDASSALLDYLGGEHCRLFAPPSDGGAAAEMEITVESMDALVAAGRGIDSTLDALRALEVHGKQVHTFDELRPLVLAIAEQPQAAPAGAAASAAASESAAAPPTAAPQPAVAEAAVSAPAAAQ
jgi:hypothetical protein